MIVYKIMFWSTLVLAASYAVALGADWWIRWKYGDDA